MYTHEHATAILKAHFEAPNAIVAHQIESYNDFINFGMQSIIDQEGQVSVNNYTVKFGQISLSEPQVIEEDRSLNTLYPMDCRRRDLNYDSAIFLDMVEIFSDEEKPKIHTREVIGRMPVMLKSSICNLSKLSPDDQIKYGECPNDPGGYFIIKGNERVLVGQLRTAYNQVFVLKQKVTEKYKYIAEVRSMSDETGHSILIQAMIGQDDRTINFSLPYIKEHIPVGVVFKALGYTSDEEITNLINLPKSKKSEKYIKFILRDSFFCQTKEEALSFIGKYPIHIIGEEKKELYAWQVLETELLPHLGVSASIKENACFLGNMIRKLISTHIGLRDVDDRDNYANKRVEVAGTLISDIFRNLFKKWISHIKDYLEKRKQRPDILTIISRSKSITKGLNQCMSTGNWCVQKNASYMRTGVSQVLDRMTYYAFLSHLRRVLIPVGKEGKNVAIRQLHQSSWGFVDPCESPEGQRIGIVLNFAITCKITKRVPTVNIRRILEKCKSFFLVQDSDITSPEFTKMTPIFLNFIIIGFTKKPEKTINEIRNLRNIGMIDREVSVTYDILDNDIKIFCDEGRFIRPLLVLENNSLKLPLKNKYNWESLIKKGYIRYLDASEIENSVLAMTPKYFEKQISDYCEIHPSVILGVLSGKIPFPDHSQSPRNCYSCLWEEETVLMGDFSLRKIKDIKVGDIVVSINPNTLEKTLTSVVNHYVKPTEKDIVKITTLNDESLILTDDHLVLSLFGWKKAGELSTKDMICVCYEYNITMFIPVKSVVPHHNVMIADITTESDNHTFITGSKIVVHNSSMGKQALGTPLLSYNIRTDTLLHVLHYAQRPIVYTNIARMTKMDEMPSGINAIVAIACWATNQEDSVCLNKSATQRGLFCLTSYHTIDCCEKKRGTYSFEKICMPPRNSEGRLEQGMVGYFRRKNANYSLLDNNGIVRARNSKGGCIVVKKGDVLVGKVVITGNKIGEETKKDASVVVQPGEEGTIDRVHVYTTPNGYKLVKVVIRVTREPTLGDKLASTEGQKGTIGMVYRQEDLPYTSDGVVPDIIINSFCMPSRMTINQLLECALGKKALITGKYQDATPFTEESEDVADKTIKEMSSKITTYGFSPYGWSTMYSGHTGEMIKAKIFIGPTYYQRLKHMVDDKMHARASGVYQNLTRQPLEGRSRDGGLRLGEMERDCLIYHGGSQVLKDRLFTCSDPFRMPICKRCGIMTATNIECQACKSDDITKVNFPFASKLLVTELGAMCIKMTFKASEQ